MSDFHPESWSPIWRVSTIIEGLISFMLGDEITTGAIRSTNASIRIAAAKSWSENMRNPNFPKIFGDYFDIIEPKDAPPVVEAEEPAAPVNPIIVWAQGVNKDVALFFGIMVVIVCASIYKNVLT
jgi:ubiquitin-conjugating enzyme E2 J2